MAKVIGFAERENAAAGPSSAKNFGISLGCGGGDPMTRCRSMLLHMVSPKTPGARNQSQVILLELLA